MRIGGLHGISHQMGKKHQGLLGEGEEFELYRSENQNQDLINWAKKAQERIKKYEN